MPFMYWRRRQPANAHWGKANSTYKLYGNIICLDKLILIYDYLIRLPDILDVFIKRPNKYPLKNSSMKNLLISDTTINGCIQPSVINIDLVDILPSTIDRRQPSHRWHCSQWMHTAFRYKERSDIYSTQYDR